jgi:hypothetical protein
MPSTEETLAAMRREIRPLLETAMEGVLTTARGVLEEAEQQRIKGLAEVAEERIKGLSDMAEEHVKGLAEIDVRRRELGHEVEAMHKHKEAQEGCVELNIGGYHFQTSVQALRRVPHTFFASTSAAGTRRTCAATAASSWTGMASTSVTSSNTFATA